MGERDAILVTAHSATLHLFSCLKCSSFGSSCGFQLNSPLPSGPLCPSWVPIGHSLVMFCVFIVLLAEIATSPAPLIIASSLIKALAPWGQALLACLLLRQHLV